MSSRQLEERYEREQAQAVAEALGISLEDLEDQDWSIEPQVGNGGVETGNIVTFNVGSDPEVLKQIKGLNDGRWVWIGLMHDDPEPDEPDSDAEESPILTYQLLVAGIAGPCPLGSREADRLPMIGEMLTQVIDGERRAIEVVGIQHLPVVPSGTFKHDQTWVIGRFI